METMKLSRQNPSGDGRLPALDGVRGSAFLLVFLYHIRYFAVQPAETGWEHIYSNVVSLGWTGVGLFFVLSGFLITGILLDTRDNPDYFKAFYLRRTVRIFPLYYVSLATLFVALPFALDLIGRGRLVDRSLIHSSQLSAWFYFLNWQAGLRGFETVTPLASHFWSLAIEEQFYLVWPTVVRKFTPRVLAMVCGAMVLVSLVLRIILHLNHLPDLAYAETFSWTDALAMGSFLAIALRRPSSWKIVTAIVPYVAIVAFASLALLFWRTENTSGGSLSWGTIGMTLTSALFAACLALIVNSPPAGIANRIASSSPLRFFGKYSYCLYVCHQPIIVLLIASGWGVDRFTHVLGHRSIAIVALHCIALGLSITVSLISWNLLEKQFLKLKRVPMFNYRKARLYDHERVPVTAGSTQ
jgi:peptidoglycan/LPS O-acetylase OafA/YrhL